MQDPLGPDHTPSDCPDHTSADRKDGVQDRRRFATLRRWFAQHPWWGSILLFLYFMGLAALFSFALGIVGEFWQLSFIAKLLLVECFYALLVALPLTLLGWWSEVGFTRWTGERDLSLYFVPFIVLALPSLALLPSLFPKCTPLQIVAVAVFVLLVGFVEEGFFRGVLLRCALPAGIWPAVISSTLFFSLAHLGNVFSGFSWNYVVAQVMLTFGMGLLFAALRLRSGTIWICILLHALHDSAGIIELLLNPRLLFSIDLTSTLIAGSFYLVVLVACTLFILRPAKVRELRRRYGLESGLD